MMPMIVRTLILIYPFIILSNTHAQSTKNDYAIYCKQAGGVVELMPAVFSTSKGSESGLSKRFCTFNADQGFIVIGLETFSSKAPNIAATYMKKLRPIGDDSPLFKGKPGNPSHNVCLNLGGSVLGFVSGGGFTNALGESDICVFGDGSMVSAWSLIYMANHRTGYDVIKDKVRSQALMIQVP